MWEAGGSWLRKHKGWPKGRGLKEEKGGAEALAPGLGLEKFPYGWGTTGINSHSGMGVQEFVKSVWNYKITEGCLMQ